MRAFESGWDRVRYDQGIIQDWQLDQWAGGPVEQFFPSYSSWSQLSDAEWDAMSYRSMNSFGFVGYQFGEAFLIDLGYYDDDFYYGNGAATNTWDGTWTGKNGVDSLEEFMVFQKPVMLRRSLRANILYGLKLQGFPPDQRQQRASDALEHTGLTDRADQQAVSLSAGEQQRLALARAWALAPEILFLDEPTASLDPGATAAVEAIVNQIHDAGTKIVMTTHDLGQAKRLADEVIFLQGGKVAERTAARAFFEGPKSEAGRAFLGGELMW